MEENNMTKIQAPKSLTKTDLYDHLEDLHNKRLSKLKAKYQPQLRLLLNEIYNYLEPELLLAEDVRKGMLETDWNYLYDMMNDYDYYKIGNALFNLKAPVHIQAQKRFEYFIGNMTTISWDEKTLESRPELEFLTENFNEEMRRYFSERDQSKQLKKELWRIVKSEKRPKKAFETLHELGLDMTKFKPAVAELPAVVRTSVDIAIFNELVNE